jgi:uncharacterized protein (DUF433 family)
MDVIEVTETVPLGIDAHGVYRIGGTRVILDLVIRAFNRGATPEEIVDDYTGLQLFEVYQVIGYYLKHKSELDEYVERRQREEKNILAAHPEWSPKGLRDRLLARQKNQ